MKHIGTKELHTERLLLRRFKKDDAEDMFLNWANDIEVCRYLTWKPHENIEVTKQIVNSWINSYEKEDFYNWAIVIKDNNELIGNISVVESNDELGLLTTGYCISKKHWGKGYTTEALERLLKFFFEEVGSNIVVGRHSVENPSSGKVMLKVGMKYEGTLRKRDICISGITDMAMYSILKEEYLERC